MRYLLVAALVTVPAALLSQPDASQLFLRNVFGFTNTDIREIAEGRVAVRSLDTEDGREIAIVGAIRMPISPEQYITQLKDIVAFKRHEAVQQIGVFGTPPQVGDVAGLTLDADHVDDLRDCRPGDCDIQLSRAAIAKIAAVPWSGPDAESQANRVMRELLTEVASNYRRQGDSTLMVYENDDEPISVADEFRLMTAAAPAVLQLFPALNRHVQQFPSGTASGIDDVFYWSKEDVGPKVIISVTHIAISAIADGPVAFAAASKQLYGSHYFDASLGLTLLLRDDQPSSTVLIYLNRSRIDALHGFFGGLKRAIVRSRARSAMEDTLTRIRTRLPERVTTEPPRER